MREDFYVYSFYNEDWKDIFYIGKGCGNRYKDINKRGRHIKSIFENHSCTSQIIIDNLTEKAAIYIEKKIKEYYKFRGCPIIDYEAEGRVASQRFGIEEAKQQGKYKGRQPIKIDEMQFKEVCERWRKGEITAKSAMGELDLKPNTFYRRVRELNF